MKPTHSLIIIIFVLAKISSAETNEQKTGAVYQLINELHQYIIENNALFAEMDELNKGVTDRLRIEILSNDELQKKYQEHTGDNAQKVESFYEVKTKTIYLHDQLDLSTLEGRSTILHEYVHFLQFAYGLDQSISVCINELEKDAYELEIKYLTDNGEPKDSDIIQSLRFRKLLNSDCGPPSRRRKFTCKHNLCKDFPI